MAFHFSLESVLRFRREVETKEELRLQEANRALVLKREEMARLDEYLKARRERVHRGIDEGTVASELQFEAASQTMLQAHRRQLIEAARRLEAARDRQREIFQKARMGREVLESVRAQQLQIHREDKARRDQRNMDDLFLMRRKSPLPR